MFLVYSVLCLALLHISYYISISGERVAKRIYFDLKNFHSCIRRLNATHQTGCSTDPDGVVGTLQHIADAKQLEWFLNSGSSGNPPYIVALEMHLFNRPLLDTFTNNGGVSGVILLVRPRQNIINDSVPRPEELGYPSTLSWDTKCPNERYSLYYPEKDSGGSCPNGSDWNPSGTSLLREDLPLPVFMMNSERAGHDINRLLKDCYEAYNKPNAEGSAPSGTVCAVQMSSFQWAARDARTCLHRTNSWKNELINLVQVPFCDQFLSQNVWATLKPMNRNETRQNRSVIIVTAKMDTASPFDDWIQSAESTSASLVVLLAAAQVLGTHKALLRTAPNDVLFALFHGETWDYMGSTRFVQKLLHTGSLPGDQLSILELQHVQLVLELSQVGRASDRAQYWLHSDPLTRARFPSLERDIDGFAGEFSALAANLNAEPCQTHAISINRTDSEQKLPPASLQQFLSGALKANFALPALMLADYNTKFNNSYYHSEADVLEGLGYSRLCARGSKLFNTSGPAVTAAVRARCDATVTRLTGLATLVARFLIGRAFDGRPPVGLIENATALNEIVEDLLKCLMLNKQCDIFLRSVSQEFSESLKFQGIAPFNQYVFSERDHNGLASLMYNVLAYFLGVQLHVSWENCTSKHFPTDGPYEYFRIYDYSNSSNSSFGGPDFKPGELCLRSLSFLDTLTSAAFNNDGTRITDDRFAAWVESRSGEPTMRIFLATSFVFRTVLLAISIVYTVAVFVLVYLLRNWFARNCPLITASLSSVGFSPPAESRRRFSPPVHAVHPAATAASSALIPPNVSSSASQPQPAVRFEQRGFFEVNPSSAGPTLSAPANAPGAINEGASLSSAVIA